MNDLLIALGTALTVATSTISGTTTNNIGNRHLVVLGEQVLSLKTRYPDNSVNKVFAKNIINYLLTLSLLDPEGLKSDEDGYSFSIKLNPGDILAFHKEILKEFTNRNVISSPTELSPQEGYETLNGLSANGVCHIASFINQVASEANLVVTAKVNHDFAPVPDVPKKYGTSIYYMKGGGNNSKNQNLYIENNYSAPVYLHFTISPETVKLTITQ